jgi:L-ribulokinase
LRIHRGHDAFHSEAVVGLGVDTTGSTPLPVDEKGRPLSADDRFADDLNAKAWLWKDHTAHEEAEDITEAAREMRPTPHRPRSTGP